MKKKSKYDEVFQTDLTFKEAMKKVAITTKQTLSEPLNGIKSKQKYVKGKNYKSHP